MASESIKIRPTGLFTYATCMAMPAVLVGNDSHIGNCSRVKGVVLWWRDAGEPSGANDPEPVEIEEPVSLD